MKWVFMFQFNWYEEGYFCEKIIVDDYLMIKTINKAFNNNNSSSSNFYLMFRIYQHYFGEGKGNPLQYSCLENLVDGGAWWAAVHRVTQSQTRLKRLSMHECIGEENSNPLQYSCLENPSDRGAWWAAISWVAESDMTEAT